MSAPHSVPSDSIYDRSARTEWTPVFVDATGHRRRWLRRVGYVAAIACLLFAIVLVTSLLWSPITPDKSRATSTGHDTTTSQQISFAHAADRGPGDG
jgi:hypothetical protein